MVIVRGNACFSLALRCDELFLSLLMQPKLVLVLSQTKTNVAHDKLYCNFVSQPTFFCVCILNLFICLGRELFMSKSVCWNGSTCFLFQCIPLMHSESHSLSESHILKWAIAPRQTQACCIWKSEYNYSFIRDIIILSENIHCPIFPDLLIRFCMPFVFCFFLS